MTTLDTALLDASRLRALAVLRIVTACLCIPRGTAMLGWLAFTLLRDALFTHPTAAEGLTVLLASAGK